MALGRVAATLVLALTQAALPVTAAVRIDDASRAAIATHLAQADEAFAQGRWSLAREHYSLLLRLLPPPLTVTVHEQMARCYGHEGQPEKQLEHLQVLLDRDPSNMRLKVLMATEALKGGLLERGQAMLRVVDETQVRDAEAYFDVAALFVNLGRTQDAVRYFTKALEVDAGYVDGYFQRGLAYLQLERHDEARADFVEVIAMSPAGGLQAATAREALARLP